MHESCTAGCLLWCADTDHRQLLRNSYILERMLGTPLLSCSTGTEMCTSSDKMWEALRSSSGEGEGLGGCGPCVKEWGSEGLERSCLHLCGLQWCWLHASLQELVQQSVQNWKTPEVGKCVKSGRSGHGWGTLEDRCTCIGTQLITAPHMHIINIPTSVGGWKNNVYMDSDVWQAATGLRGTAIPSWIMRTWAVKISFCGTMQGPALPYLSSHMHAAHINTHKKSEIPPHSP